MKEVKFVNEIISFGYSKEGQYLEDSESFFHLSHIIQTQDSLNV